MGGGEGVKLSQPFNYMREKWVRSLWVRSIVARFNFDMCTIST